MKPFIYFAGLLPTILCADTIMPISDSQADAIVAAEVAAKKAEREAKQIDFTVLQRRTIVLPDRTLTMNRVAPPDLPQRTAQANTPKMTPAQRQALQEEMEQIKLISVVATVYDKSITLVRWNNKEGQQYSAWVRADFNLFRPLQEFTLGDQTYRMSALVLNESSEELEERRKLAREQGYDIQLPVIPNLPEATDGVTEYFVESDDPAISEDDTAFEGIEAMLLHLDASYADLVTALQRQEAITEARKRYKAANPKSPDTKLIYWYKE